MNLTFKVKCSSCSSLIAVKKKPESLIKCDICGEHPVFHCPKCNNLVHFVDYSVYMIDGKEPIDAEIDS